jgi:periplasmic protein TonB
MSLVQTYRAEIADRQTRQFLVYLALAFGVHALAAASFLIWRPLNSQTPKISKSPTPLEFVYVEPQKLAPSPNPQARQAQTNATAGGNRDQNRPIQTAPRSSSAPSSSAPSSSVTQLLAPPAPLPARAIPAEPTARPAPAQATARPASAAPNSQSLQRPVASPITRPSTNPPVTSPPALRPPASSSGSASSLAAQLGNHTVSIEQGTAAPFNPNRTATGSGVDAVQNDLWGGYLAALNRTVEQNWRQVSVAATSRTRIQFRVDRQGQVTGLQILEPSGNTVADQAAMQAVRAAAPFAPLPQNATEDTLIVNFTFTQWLNPDAQ